MSEKEIETFTCCECGIKFGFSNEVAELWRKQRSDGKKKLFYCPNGHGLEFSGETQDQKELKTLREKVKDLQTKLEAALKDVADQKKRADELATELEIWRPTTQETKDGSEQTGSGDRAG